MSSIIDDTTSDIVKSVLNDMQTDAELRTRLNLPQFQTKAAEMYIRQKFSTCTQEEQQTATKKLLLQLQNSKLSSTIKTETSNIKSNAKTATSEELANRAKDSGNVAFAAKDYETAIKHYNQGLSYNIAKLNSVLYSNISACAIALNNYDHAESAANSCLLLQPNNLKALYRKATAQHHLDKVEESLATLTIGKNLDEGLYSDKSKKKLMKSIIKLRNIVLNKLNEMPIESYSFSDEGKPKVKVYIPLKEIGLLPKDDILCTFKRISMDLIIKGYKGKNLRLYAAELWSSIDPKRCKVKIKADMIVISLQKAQNDGMRPWEKLRR
jgi:tetratricopeptide (TPR) repeat protein